MRLGKKSVQELVIKGLLRKPNGTVLNIDSLACHGLTVGEYGEIDFDVDYNGYSELYPFHPERKNRGVNLKTWFKLNLPKDVCGIVSTRSWAAREGIDVCGSSVVIHPNFNNHIVLEITSRYDRIVLPHDSGKSIAQLTLWRSEDA
jgi:deoxycytidine triphosphate deaminase